MKKSIFPVILSLFLSACSMGSDKMLVPHNLVSTSSEKVSFGLVNNSSVDSISGWIVDDVPTGAEISCNKADSLCKRAKDVLNSHFIPYKEAKSSYGADAVTLIYDRSVAKDCDGRVFGCSVSANTVQMVTNRSVFVEPPLSDPQDAERMLRGISH